MELLEKACQYVLSYFSGFAIASIVETSQHWIFSLCEPEGEPVDMEFIYVDRQTGTFSDLDSEEEYQGGSTLLEVPEAYQSVETKIYQRLMAENSVNNPEEYKKTLRLALELLLSNAQKSTPSEFYARTQYLTELILQFCDKKDYYFVVRIRKNPLVTSFLQCTVEEQMEACGEYRWKPETWKRYQALGEEILSFVMEELQKWATLLLMHESAEPGQEQKLELALLRAMFLEDLAGKMLGNLSRQDSYFIYLKGMLSIFPEETRNEILDSLAYELDPDFLDEANDLLLFNNAYETGCYEMVDIYLQEKQITEGIVMGCYKNAISRVNEALKGF